MLLLGLFGHVSISPFISLPLWFLLLVPLCIYCWPANVPIFPANWFGSITLGALVFGLWVAPDVLVPGYRNFPLFSNALLGHVHSSLPEGALHSPWVLGWRTARAVLIVPIVEELFWRGWLMRWLINNDFERVRLGAYTPSAFWITAVLFASEHGSYWDVGLVTGAVYNLWMVRTKSLANCVLMHAVTNGLLCAYVIYAGQWQYWQ